MKKSDNKVKKTQDIDSILGIEISRKDDGTKILKMGNNVYEFPIDFSYEDKKVA
jgi:hypothetical protein